MPKTHVEILSLVLGLRKRPVAAFAFAFLALGLATGARLAMDDVLPPGFPYLTFFPAVIATTFLAGTAPGILVAVLSALAALYLFIPPYGSLKADAPTVLASLLFLFVAMVIVGLTHVMTGAFARLKAERERSDSLARNRELLLRELQHRISNNLQLVSGLMRMQRTRVDDPTARKVLDEAANRLILIGKLHRQLHNASGEGLRFDVFLKDLCHDLLEASGARNVVCLVKAEPLPVGPDHTIPIALVASELVGNALRHGFAGRETGTINVTLDTQADGWLALTVADDGPGLAEGFDPLTGGSLGLRIVRALASQVDGQFDMFSRDGTVGRLTFPA